MMRGDIWWADFGIPFGSEPGFIRPVIVIQADSFNKSKINTSIVIPLSTNLNLEFAPGNVLIDKDSINLPKDSVAVVSQISVIDKDRLKEKSSKLDYNAMKEIERGIMLVLGIE
jgi:mRNA interferase MazF